MINELKNCNQEFVKIIKLLFIITIIFSLCSCDPPLLLTFTNNTPKPIELEITLTDTSSCYSEFRKGFELAENEGTKEIKLDITKDNNSESIFFGIGTWHPDAFGILLGCIDSIKIIEEGKPIKKIDADILREMYPEIRKGLLKNIIKIEVSE